MADDLSMRYADLLSGSFDCAVRIVLTAFLPFGCSPGGFRTWWRTLHDGSDEHLDDTRLMRMAGRFGRRVRWGRVGRSAGHHAVGHADELMVGDVGPARVVVIGLARDDDAGAQDADG